MKKYINDRGERTVVVEDLSFLRDRDHFTWLQRHWYNIRHRRALRQADNIVAVDEKVAADIVKYYFIPKSRISLQHSPGGC